MAKRASPGGVLAMVERYRIAGQFQDAQAALASVVEDFPRLPCVRQVYFEPDTPIRWLDIMYPKRTAGRIPTLECHGL